MSLPDCGFVQARSPKHAPMRAATTADNFYLAFPLQSCQHFLDQLLAGGRSHPLGIWLDGHRGVAVALLDREFIHHDLLHAG